MLRYYKKLLQRFGRRPASPRNGTLLHKYTAYRSLLTHNTGSLTIISDLEMLLREGRPFTIDHVVAYTETLVGSVGKIVESLNALCGGKYQELEGTVHRIGGRVLSELTRPKDIVGGDLVVPLSGLSRDRLDEVGGKAANYGEIANRAGLPVAPGFAVTATACQRFLHETGLSNIIAGMVRDLDIEDTGELGRVSREIGALIQAAVLPAELAGAIARAAEDLARSVGPDLRMSVRSSATCEDSESSFAGQYASILNVRPRSVLEAYKEVVASTFTPRAIFYRRTKGYAESDVVMSTLCLAMVDAAVSGVLYTVDPTDPGSGKIIVSAAYGLGVSVVDGSAAVDIYRVDKAGGGIAMEIARKTSRVVMADGGGLADEAVPEALGRAACLSDADILALTGYGLKLEAHYGLPLDIEWAKGKDGAILILQARPLNPPDAPKDEADAGTAAPDPVEHPVLIEGGHCASPGVACGPSHLLADESALPAVPEGVILVAPQTSPAYVAIMSRLKGIVTDLGSVTGHMAAVAREFELPTLVAMERATTAIADGEEITVDASRRRVYRGRVAALLNKRKKANPMAGSPVYTLARSAMAAIAPLTLTDPHAPNFTPQGCRTLHDVIRLAHEISMREMFRIGDYLEDDEGKAVRLRVKLPMIIYCVDLGGGLSMAPGKAVASDTDIASAPLRHLLQGMTHRDVTWTGAVGMNMSGLVSLMAQSVLSDPTAEGRFGGPNYVVISKEYLNFNARLGYHFAVVDSYCGPAADENYIAFSFKGGAADEARRERRARLIGRILARFGMRVEQKGDMIRGELKEGKTAQIADRLDQLGRLLGSVRLLDTAITDDSQLDWYEEEFFKGNYTFSRA